MFYSILSVAICIIHFQSMAVCQDKTNGLSIEEESKIRAIIYIGEISIETDYDEFPPVRKLVIPDSLKESFKEHPVDVSKLLLSIVQGGSPLHSHAAFSYLNEVSLKESERASFLPATSFSNYDSEVGDTGVTERSNNVRIAKEILAKVETIQREK